jgi:hypothetical protein
MTKIKNVALSVPASQAWLFMQAKGYYERSVDGPTPAGRDANRRKFIAAARQLLATTKPEVVIRVWEVMEACPADARAIISALADHTATASSPAAHSATLATVDMSEVNRLLTAALPPLLKALKLLNPEAAQ